MSILLTGGAGYIGSHCNKVFKENGYHTLILDNLSNGNKEAVSGTELIVGDIGDSNLLNSIFLKNEIEGVIHLAAKKSVEESVSNPNIYYEENVVKTKILMDSMIKNSIPYLVLSSTASVYGNVNMDIIDENCPTEPINPYGATKLIDERMMQDYALAYDFRYCSLRYFNAAGADPSGEIGSSGAKEKNIMPILMKAAKDEVELTVFGDDYDTPDGTCIRDYIHVMDLAEAHLLAFQYLKEHKESQIINLGSNNGYSVLELIRETENVTERKIKYKIGPKRPGDPKTIVASNEKAKRLLGWKPKYSAIWDIIKDAYNWEENKRY